MYRHQGLKRMLLLSLLTISDARPRDVPTGTCNPLDLQNRIHRCGTLVMTNLSQAEADIPKVCNNTECAIKCFDDALKPCASEPWAQTTDIKAQLVGTRYACSNPAAMEAAMKSCASYLVSSTCIGKLFSDIKSLAVSIPSSASLLSTTFINGYCRILKAYKTCSATTPLETIGSCTNAQAQMINTIYDISFSNRACGLNQTHPYFATYGGPVRCSTSIFG